MAFFRRLEGSAEKFNAFTRFCRTSQPLYSQEQLFFFFFLVVDQVLTHGVEYGLHLSSTSILFLDILIGKKKKKMGKEGWEKLN